MRDLEPLGAAFDALRDRVRAGLGGAGIDADQTAANEVAWSAAYVQSARATDEWAVETGSDRARSIADAATALAHGYVVGGGAEARIDEGRLLDVLADDAGSVEGIGGTAEHQLLRDSFRAFASAEVEPVAAKLHRENLDIPESIIGGLGELGAFAFPIPEEYDGFGAEDDIEAMLIATEELSRVSLAVGSLSTRSEILVRALLRGGTSEQKKLWLPRIASGESLVAVAVTEPDHGSDVAGLRCRATRVDGGWEVSGTKLWCTFAGRAELLMLLLRTSDNGHRGLSVFVAEKPAFSGEAFELEQPGGGRLAGRAIPTIGYRGMHTFELVFERFFIPDSGLVGGDEWLDRGFYLQMEGFATGRLQTAARAVGVMQAAVERAAAYARDREIFGKSLMELGLPRATIGRMGVRLETSRQLNRAAGRAVAGGLDGMEASLAKLYASRMAEYVTRDAMQLHGGMGYAEETHISQLYLDARVLAIFEGAEDVLALRVIARELLEGR